MKRTRTRLYSMLGGDTLSEAEFTALLKEKGLM